LSITLTAREVQEALEKRISKGLFALGAALEKLSREMGLDSLGARGPADDSRSPFGPWG
jgi:hypothetical protein